MYVHEEKRIVALDTNVSCLVLKLDYSVTAAIAFAFSPSLP